MHIEGHGLGLTICKRIIDCHNGHIQLNSQLGEGTTITMTFPKKQ
jgi:signal transduction histidine kinase